MANQQPVRAWSILHQFETTRQLLKHCKPPCTLGSHLRAVQTQWLSYWYLSRYDAIHFLSYGGLYTSRALASITRTHRLQYLLQRESATHADDALSMRIEYE